LEFEWDDNKCEQIFRTRGFDFGFAAQAFLDTKAVNRLDIRSNYGEDRFRLCGHAEGRLVVVVYTKRETHFKIITAWKANEREIQVYAGWQLAEGNI